MNRTWTNTAYLFLTAFLISCAEQSKEIIEFSPDSKSIFDTLSHIIYAEITKYTLITLAIVAAPIITIIIFRVQRLRNKIKDIRVYLGRKKMKWKFEKAYENEDRKALRDINISNALNEARSTDKFAKRSAIEQLSQFSEDRAVNGLIEILFSENSPSFRKIMIEALCNMIHIDG